MEEEWITDDAAVEWQCREYAIPPAVAESRLREAWELGYVPMRETITRVIEEPNGEFRGEYIPPRLGPLGLKHEPRLHFEVLRWQIEQLFGKPKPPRDQKPAQAALNAALLDFAEERGRKIKQDDQEACGILKGMGATTRQIPKAFRSLPQEYSFQRGSPGKASV